MAKGQASKEQFFNKILEVFPGSFMYNGGKEVRISFEENGEPIQLKIAATCAKVPVSADGAEITPTPVASAFDTVSDSKVTKTASVEVTKEEKDNVAALLSSLGLV